MSADTMKMPDPIIEPATSIVESKRPRPLVNSESSPAAAAVAPLIDGEGAEIVSGGDVCGTNALCPRRGDLTTLYFFGRSGSTDRRAPCEAGVRRSALLGSVAKAR